MLVVVVGLVAAFLGARHLDSAEAHPDSVEQRMADDPAPTLFPQSVTGPVSDEMGGERAAAAKLAPSGSRSTATTRTTPPSPPG